MAHGEGRNPKSPPVSLPDWLPPPIAEFVRRCEYDAVSGEATTTFEFTLAEIGLVGPGLMFPAGIWRNSDTRDRLLRLATRAEMRCAWTALATDTLRPDIDPSIRSGILERYLFAALNPHDVIAKSLGRQRQRLREIRQYARALRRQLGSPVSGEWTAWKVLDEGLQRMEWNTPLQRQLRALKEQSRGYYWNGGEYCDLTPVFSWPVFGPLPELLDALAGLAEFTNGVALPKPPKGGANAERNAFILLTCPIFCTSRIERLLHHRRL